MPSNSIISENVASRILNGDSARIPSPLGVERMRRRYAAMIISDSDAEMTAANMTKVIKAAGASVLDINRLSQFLHDLV